MTHPTTKNAEYPPGTPFVMFFCEIPKLLRDISDCVKKSCKIKTVEETPLIKISENTGVWKRMYPKYEDVHACIGEQVYTHKWTLYLRLAYREVKTWSSMSPYSLIKGGLPVKCLNISWKKKIYIYIWPIYSIFFHLDQWKRAFGVDLNEQGFRKRLISLERGYQVYIF